MEQNEESRLGEAWYMLDRADDKYLLSTAIAVIAASGLAAYFTSGMSLLARIGCIGGAALGGIVVGNIIAGKQMEACEQNVARLQYLTQARQPHVSKEILGPQQGPIRFTDEEARLIVRDAAKESGAIDSLARYAATSDSEERKKIRASWEERMAARKTSSIDQDAAGKTRA